MSLIEAIRLIIFQIEALAPEMKLGRIKYIQWIINKQKINNFPHFHFIGRGVGIAVSIHLLVDEGCAYSHRWTPILHRLKIAVNVTSVRTQRC